MVRSINIQLWLVIPKDITSATDLLTETISAITTRTDPIKDITTLTEHISNITTIKIPNIVTPHAIAIIPTTAITKRPIQMRIDTIKQSEWNQPSVKMATAITKALTICINTMNGTIVN